MIVTCPDCHHSRLLRSVVTRDLIPTYKYVDEGCQNCLKPEPIKAPQRFMVSAQPSALQAPEGAPLPEDAIREDQIRAADVQQFPLEALRILGLEPNPPSEPNQSMPLRSTERE